MSALHPWTSDLLIEVLGPDIAAQIEPDAMLVDDLGADSLDLVELQMHLDDREIPAPDDAFVMHMRVRDYDALIVAAMGGAK